MKLHDEKKLNAKLVHFMLGKGCVCPVGQGDECPNHKELPEVDRPAPPYPVFTRDREALMMLRVRLELEGWFLGIQWHYDEQGRPITVQGMEYRGPVLYPQGNTITVQCEPRNEVAALAQLMGAVIDRVTNQPRLVVAR